MATIHAVVNEIKKLIMALSNVLRTAMAKLSFCISSQIICSVLAGDGIIPVSLNLVSASTHQIAMIAAKDNNEKTTPWRLVCRIKENVRGKPSAD